MYLQYIHDLVPITFVYLNVVCVYTYSPYKVTRCYTCSPWQVTSGGDVDKRRAAKFALMPNGVHNFTFYYFGK